MSIAGCPGAERIRASFPDEVSCVCGEKVEMWPDEFEMSCAVCGRAVERTVPPTCIEWCAAARECVGDRLYEKYMRQRKKRATDDLKEKLLKAMRSYFGGDKKRISHAEKVAAYAEEIMREEKGHYGVAIAASILHDIGIPESERKYGSANTEYQEKEGPPIARKIMEKMGIDKSVTDEACDIIRHHHSPGKRESASFKIVHDADRIVNIEETFDIRDRREMEELFSDGFLTEAAREIVSKLLLEKGYLQRKG